MAGNEEEVLKIAKKLDKMASKKITDNALDILTALKDIPISLETLQKTRIGMSVNNVRKQTSNDEVAAMAKQLIKGWKKLLPSDSSKKSDDKGKEHAVKISKSSDKTEQSQSKMNNDNDHVAPDDECTEIMTTDNPVRDKCRELLLKGLLTGSGEPTALHTSRCTFLAAAIETAIHNEFRNTNIKYKNRIRSRFSNLKDTKNSSLRMNVLSGVVSPERLAKMTAEEMASDEMKKQREQFEKESINDHQMSTNEGTVTDMFTCGRCKGKQCTYTQLQTRSSDEPMTTFVFCNQCGNRWKFC